MIKLCHDCYTVCLVGMNAFSVRISQLPDITEKIMPVWEEMRDSKKHKCIICGKERLHLERYADHMVYIHQVSLKKPDLEEYKEESTEKELKTITCDYDSETGKRYSEDESGEESNSDDGYNHKKDKSSTESHSSSGSSSEDSTGSYQKKKKRTKKVMKEAPSMVSLDQYKKDKEEFSNHLEGQIKAMETKVRDMWSNNTTLKN